MIDDYWLRLNKTQMWHQWFNNVRLSPSVTLKKSNNYKIILLYNIIIIKLF